MIEPIFQNENVTLYCGDCLEIMPQLNTFIDCCITDLPYAMTNCKWDKLIPFKPIWEQLKRLVKIDGAICLFGSQPFSSLLRCSNLDMFKYDWIWDKVNLYTGALLANKRPLKRHEIISVFYQKIPLYNKQYRKGKKYIRKRENDKGVGEYASQTIKRIDTINNGLHNPCSILQIKANQSGRGLHPTQKPVELIEYLIKTYTNENELVLDFTAGSGTTGIACMNTNRRCILIEKQPKYCEMIVNRIKGQVKQESKPKQPQNAFQMELFK